MEEHRFDALVRRWGEVGRTRRGLAALVVGAAGALRGHGAAAGCAKAGKRCGRGKRCCEGARCKHGRCRCPAAPFKKCGSQCVNVVTDPNNCGDCGIHCDAGQRCVGGVCCTDLQRICTSPGECCAGQCAPIANDKGGNFGCGFLGGNARCCLPSGSDRCDSDCDCCGAGLCRDGRCCGQPGDSCFAPNECCHGTCTDFVCV